jgi:flagellar assembly factor FliW
MDATTPDDTLTAETTRFGACAYREAEVLSFPWGLPGFAQLRRFIVLQGADTPQFLWLQSLEEANVALPLVDPWSVFDDYDPHLPNYARIALDLQNPDEFTILAVCVVGRDAREMTVNLLAPVVVNLRTRIGRQVTLDTGNYSVRTPMPRKEPHLSLVPDPLETAV